MRVVLVLLCVVAAASAASHLRTAFQRGEASEKLEVLLMPRFREVLALKPNWNLISSLPQAYQFAKGKVDSSKTALEDEPKSKDDLDQYLNNQLTRDKRKATFDEFLKMYKKISESDAPNNRLWDNALKEMLDLLFSASINDPTYYVSHAADHGIRVDILWENYLRTLKGVTKMVRKQLFNIAPSTAVKEGEKADITREAAPPKLKVDVDMYCRLIVGIAHILHDVGYSGLPYGISPKLKWTHAINGAELVIKKLKDSLGKVIPAEHFRLIVEAIRDHNADSEACKDAGCPYNGKAFNDDKHNPDKSLFPVGGVGIVASGDISKLMVRKYRAASLDPAAKEFDPLLWLLRFADNGDAARLRLTEGQRNAGVMRCWRDLAVGCDISKKRDDIKKTNPNGDLSDEDVNTIKNSLPSCQKVKTENPTYYEELIAPPAINHFSFLHYYSNYVVKRMYWKDMSSPKSTGAGDSPDADAFKRTLVVEFYADPELESDLAVANFPGPAAYQIIRFAEAAESLLLPGGAKITEQVTIEMVNFPSKPEKRTVPLAAFNPKTAITNPAQCKLYNDNFAAKQKCFDKEGKITTTDILPLDKGFTPITCPGAASAAQASARQVQNPKKKKN